MWEGYGYSMTFSATRWERKGEEECAGMNGRRAEELAPSRLRESRKRTCDFSSIPGSCLGSSLPQRLQPRVHPPPRPEPRPPGPRPSGSLGTRETTAGRPARRIRVSRGMASRSTDFQIRVRGADFSVRLPLRGWRGQDALFTGGQGCPHYGGLRWACSNRWKVKPCQAPTKKFPPFRLPKRRGCIYDGAPLAFAGWRTSVPGWRNW